MQKQKKVGKIQQEREKVQLLWFLSLSLLKKIMCRSFFLFYLQTLPKVSSRIFLDTRRLCRSVRITFATQSIMAIIRRVVVVVVTNSATSTTAAAAAAVLPSTAAVVVELFSLVFFFFSNKQK